MTQLLMAQSEQTAGASMVKTCGTAGAFGLPSDFGRTEDRGAPARCIVVLGGSLRRQDQLRSALDNSRWSVDAAPTVVEVAASVRRNVADMIVVIDELLDCPLTETVLDLKRLSPGAIVVLLTQDHEPTTPTIALEIGADDVQSVTVAADELLARFDAILRRRQGWSGTTPCLDFGDVVVDTSNRRVVRAGVEVHLAPARFEILVALASHPGRTLPYAYLHRITTRHRGANTDAAHISHTVAEHVHRIRLAIEPQPREPRWIKSVRGVGYRLEPSY